MVFKYLSMYFMKQINLKFDKNNLIFKFHKKLHNKILLNIHILNVIKIKKLKCSENI